MKKVCLFMLDVALVTCAEFPDLDTDEALIIPALAQRGLHAQAAIWNDPNVDWSIPQAIVIRTAWDYHHHLPAFLAWAEHVSQFHTLWNPLNILRWNTHKFYLRDLAQKNISIVPTLWLNRGTIAPLSSLMAEHTWHKVVIKPAVSASTYATMLVTRETAEQGQEHLDQFLPSHDMLIQPFLSTVTTSHERSLIFIDGAFMHAIERMPALGLDSNGQDLLFTPQEDEILFAQTVLATLDTPILYARVDIIHDEDGKLCLMELELVEPGLWLSWAPQTVQFFADAIERKVREKARVKPSE